MSGQSSVVDNSNIYVSVDDLRRLHYQARGFSLLPRQPANSVLAGKNVSKLRGRGLNFEELRHYRPGDDIRAMDWKTTRRTGKPHIKVYTEERERNVYIIIDQRSTMFFGSTGKMKSVVGAQLAALMAWRVVESGDRVGAVIYSDTESRVVPAKRGKQHVVQVLTELTRFNHALKAAETLVDASASLNNTMKKLPTIVGNNALVVLVGDGYGWDELTTASLKKIRQHNEVIACHISDPLEMSLPKMTQMVVSDGSKQIQFSSADESIQQRYRQKLSDQLQRYRAMARKYRIPFVDIDTISPVQNQLRKALGGSA